MTGKNKAPHWFDSPDRLDCAHMDVRPILASGDDPLAEILARVDQLPPGAILQIETPFDPIPLRRLLAGRGYDSHPVRLSEDHWQVFFKYHQGAELPDFPDLPDFPVTWRDGRLEMDLRGMMPPNPMIAVLRVIESGAAGDSFTVWLDRDPVYLYPELFERHWRGKLIEQGRDGLRVEISREGEK